MHDNPVRTRRATRGGGWPGLRGGILPIALAVLVTGCGTDAISIRTFTPAVLAVTGPDSLAPGTPLQLVVYWRSTNTCDELDSFAFNAFNDSTFSLRVVAANKRTADSNCAESVDIRISTFVLDTPPAGRFTFEVFGASQRFVMVTEGGTSPASIHRFRVFVKNATSLDPVMGAVARIISTTTGDTLGVMTTGIDGTDELSLDCSGAPVPYLLDILGPSGRSAILDHRDQPARCGIAERTAITI